MRRTQYLLIFVVLLLCPAGSRAQSWSGIINPTRAIDWTQAGIPGGLPDGNWTQCGATIAAYTGPAAAINTQIQNCNANQYVLLGPGTFNLSSSIDFGNKSNVVLRGSGANATSVVFTSSAGSVSSCNLGGPSLIGICSSDTTCWAGCSGQTIYTWSAGYAKGATQITLSSTANIATVSTGKPTLIFLNQDDDGYTGFPASGSSVDNGNYFFCADQYSSSGGTGCGVDGPDGTPGGNLQHRYQYEVVEATAINSATGVVTLSQPLKHPNWRAGQSPKAWIIQSVAQSGVENLSIDASGATSSLLAPIGIEACYQCWVSGVRVMNFGVSSVLVTMSSHYQVQNNYLYNTVGGDSYGIRTGGINGDGVVQNNILQKCETPILFDGPDSGTVIAYNYAIDDTSASDGLIQSLWAHSAGDDFQLWEGNIVTGFQIDLFHGVHLDETAFRNFSLGWDSCGNGQCGSSTAKDSGSIAMIYSAYNRYGNIIGNVLGTPGYHNTYMGPCTGNKCIFYLGVGDSPVPTDTLTATTALLWGNYDVVTGAARFCGNTSNTGFTTTCGGKSEVPTAAPVYPNSVPTVGDTGAGQSQMPASFYMNSKPSWFGAAAWPPIGPDVTGGNIGQCSGVLNAIGQFAGLPALTGSQCVATSLTAAAWGGHVNTTPAMSCYLNVMGGVPDGTKGPLTFNAAACYAGAAMPVPPTNLTAVAD